MTLFRTIDLAFSYRSTLVLRNIDFRLERGEMIAIAGPNGAGKSTLLRLLSGYLAPSAGSVVYGDRALDRWKPRELARRLAVVPQAIHFHFPFTVEQFVRLARHPYHGWSPFDTDSDLAATKRALQDVGVTDLAERSVLELSGGERQRVALAAAFAQEPETLLLDEPTTALDLRHQVDLMQALAVKNRDTGLTIVIVTHDLNIAARYCPRLVLLHQGEIVADDHTEKILNADLIRTVYGVEVEIGRRADGQTPYLLPLNGSR